MNVLKNFALITLLLTSILFVQCGSESSDAAVSNTPLQPKQLAVGRGFYGLEIGMNYQDIMAKTGGEPVRTSYDEELKAYTDFGFNPMQSLEFHTEFDYAIQFNNPTIELPIFKVFFKEDKVVYLIFSVFANSTSTAEITFLGQQAFDGSNAAFESLEEKAVKVEIPGYDGEFIYPSTGIGYVSQAGIVKVINVFEPLSEEKRAKFVQLVDQPLLTPVQ